MEEGRAQYDQILNHENNGIQLRDQISQLNSQKADLEWKVKV